MSQVIRSDDLPNFSRKETQPLRKQIENLLTPASILQQADFPEAAKILPDHFADCAAVFAARDEIRDLRALPIKDNASRVKYHLIKSELHSKVKELMGGRRLTFARNEFPYFLPQELEQYIIWVRDDVLHGEILDFLTSLFIVKKLNPEEVIMFERPRHVMTPLIRGTFPSVRHLHLWTSAWVR